MILKNSIKIAILKIAESLMICVVNSVKIECYKFYLNLSQ
jgi:hypothetical protein